MSRVIALHMDNLNLTPSTQKSCQVPQVLPGVIFEHRALSNTSVPKNQKRKNYCLILLSVKWHHHQHYLKCQRDSTGVNVLILCAA